MLFNPTKRIPLLIAGLIALYIITFAIFTVERYNRYNATGGDLGIFVHLTWNAAHGHPFRNTLTVEETILAEHSLYITAPLGALFWLWEDPRILLILQSAVLGLGAWPVARLAGRRLETPWAGPLFAVLWVFYPMLGWINRWDFHPITFATLCFAFIYDAIDRRAWREVDLWLLFALFIKEEVALNAVFFALYMGWRFQRSWRGWLPWVGIGSTWFLAHAFVVFPAFDSRDSTLPIHAGRFDWMWNGSLADRWAYLTGPDTGHKFNYLLKIFYPLSFVPLLGLDALIPVIPTFGLNLLSTNRPQFDIYMHYSAPIIPALFAAAIYGLARLRYVLDRHTWPGWRAVPVVLVGVVLAAWLLKNPLYGSSGHYAIYGWDSGANLDALREVEALIPPDACVVTENNLQPHYATRWETYVLGGSGADGGDADGCQYLIVDLGDRRHDDFAVGEAIACYQFWSGQRTPIYFRDTVVVLEWARAETDPAAWQAMGDYCAAYAAG